MRDKSHFSFLIAFTRQLEAALTDSVDDDVADSLESLGSLLAVLLSAGSDDPGGDAGGLHEADSDVDDSGDESPLGTRPRRAFRGATGAVDEPRRLVGGFAATDAGRDLLGRRESRPAILMPGRAQKRAKRATVARGGKRRAKR